jgi:hypothetical protein
MKTHAQNIIEKLKRRAAARCDARETTELLGGEWQAQGVRRCPVCGGTDALLIRDVEDSGAVAFWCTDGCSRNAIDEAVGGILGAQGVNMYDRMYDRAPWVGDD